MSSPSPPPTYLPREKRTQRDTKKVQKIKHEKKDNDNNNNKSLVVHAGMLNCKRKKI